MRFVQGPGPGRKRSELAQGQAHILWACPAKGMMKFSSKESRNPNRALALCKVHSTRGTCFRGDALMHPHARRRAAHAHNASSRLLRCERDLAAILNPRGLGRVAVWGQRMLSPSALQPPANRLPPWG